MVDSNDFKEFRTDFAFDVEQELWNVHKIKVSTTEELVQKLSEEPYYALVVKVIDSGIGVRVGVNESYSRYLNGEMYGDLVSDYAELIVDSINKAPDISGVDITHYATLRDKLMIQVVSKKNNEEALKKIPHKDFGDISIVYRVVLGENDNGCSTILFTNDMLRTYDVSENVLHEDAMAYAPKNFPPSLRGISEVIAELTGVPSSSEDDRMFVATCNNGVNGAGCIFYDGFLKEASKKIGERFYILPSSVHEVLLVKDDGSISVSELKDMVCGVNAAEVSQEERLSDSVYEFSTTGGLRLAM